MKFQKKDLTNFYALELKKYPPHPDGVSATDVADKIRRQ